jgi:hypothetical protein
MASEELAVRNVIEGIRDTLSALDVNAWLSHFSPQHTIVNRGTVFVARSLNDSKAAFAPMISGLEEQGFTGTVLDLCNIRFIDSNSAIAATQWTRLGRNDKVLERLGALYTLVKLGSEWKVAVVTVHDEDVVLFE